MNKTSIQCFEDLLKNYYGGPPPRSPRNVSDTAELFEHYYGKPRKKHHRKKHHAGPAVHGDDGETLAQPGAGEYVVGSVSGEQSLQEYVVPRAGFTSQRLLSARSMSLSAGNSVPSQEYCVDVLQPLSDAPINGSGNSQDPYAPPRRNPEVLMAKPSAAQSYHAAGEPHKAEATEDDFIADMKAILSGQTAYDPVSKRTVPKDKLGAPDQPSGSGRGGQSAAEPANGQAIFDRIALSMQHANAYDLGTVELQNRFADFDKIDDLKQKAADKKKSKTGSGAAYDVDGAAFLEDLNAIRGGSRATPAYAAATSADRWERIASEVFGRDTYADFLNDLKSCTFLGRTLNNVHDDVVQKLSVVEQDLLASQGAGYTAPPVSSTLRKKAGMHGWGMAIDFDVLRNPYVLNESGEKELDKELIVAYDHIADFMLGKAKSDIRKLKSGRSAFGSGTIAEVYDALKEESDAMKRYFSLMSDDAALASFLSQEWPTKHSGTAPSAADAKAQMIEDCEVLGGKTASGGKRPTGGKGDRPFAPSSGGGAGDPGTGFLNLPREFVIAMTAAGFAWGAIDIAGEPGDIQHFDLRLQGNGARAYNLLLKYK